MLITIFEHQTIFSKIDIPEHCFHWLMNQSYQAFTLTYKNGNVGLKARQYVGVIGTPFGTHIEILPKVFRLESNTASQIQKNITKNRIWLNNILNRNFLRFGKMQDNLAQQSSIDGLPLHGFLMTSFLDACKQIHLTGMSQTYENTQENVPYLCGKIAIQENIRQNQAHLRHHYFVQRLDVRSYHSPENRLIVSALFLLTQQTYQRQHCLQLYHMFCGVFVQHMTWQQLKHYQQRQYLQDYQQCQNKRLPLPYQKALPIAKVILAMRASGAGLGKTLGVSLLFNMHSLFEKMVCQALYQKIRHKKTLSLNHYPHTHALDFVTDAGKSLPFFTLKPDHIICDNGSVNTIIDCKWKWLDTINIKQTLRHTDVYQMIAYAMGYFEQNKDDLVQEVWLIYPQTDTFQTEMVFQLSAFKSIVLKIKPFDLKAQRIK